METNKLQSIKTISDYHSFMELPKPQHPLVSVVRFEDIKRRSADYSFKVVNGFYSVALKQIFNAKLKYGQQSYDFDEGVLAFIAPGQILSVEVENGEPINHKGWLLLIHPDFLWNTKLSQNIDNYDFFGYQLNEALHLSEKEEKMLMDIMKNIEQEYLSNIDHFSQDVIITQIELLLTYSKRFYQRQFITRKINNLSIVTKLENILKECFKSENRIFVGIPTVVDIADKLKLSPNYLSNLLKVETGKSTQQHIHDALIKKAKSKLSTTDLSISEIAYDLGFEHPQSFSKLFKRKTNLSPGQFRASFT